MQHAADKEFWKQIANLRPRLREGVDILVQDYRGERWYLLNDQTSGRFLRFNATAYEFLGRLDGDLTIEEIIEIANEADPDEPLLEPDDVMQILAQLHAAEVLRGALPLSAQDLLERYQKSLRFQKRRALSNPLALRIPLFDPDRLLTRLLGVARAIFSRGGFWIWLLVIVVAALLAMLNASELFNAISAKRLGAHEVLMFWLLYPLIKALHELGHGLAVKVWGGEVHETGISLLVFMPVPYVDATAAWAFRDKRRRAIVGAAGIMVELLLSALALFVWLIVEPGLISEIALNVTLIGGVSTLFFNGNPLLKYDGYYVFEDLVEIPSLATRSSRYYLYLIQRHLLGLRDVRPPMTAKGETAWFSIYGLLSPMYRMSMMIGIALYLAGEFLVVGIVLAGWAIFMQVIKPIFTSVRFVASSPRLEARRIRGFAVLVVAVVSLIGILSIPVPLVTHAQGVIWPDERSRVVSGVEGFVVDVVAQSGDKVGVGDILLQLNDPDLRARHGTLIARLQEMESDRVAKTARSRVRGAMIADDIVAVRKELQQVEAELEKLLVRSDSQGQYYALDPYDQRGKLIRKGDLLGFVIQPGRPLVRAVISQDRIGLLRSGDTRAEVMLVDRLGEAVPARLVREVPAGSEELPSTALGAAGGGDIAVDVSEEAGRKALEKVFQIELALPADTPMSGVGGRAYVRLYHGSEPLLKQWSRSLRQLLLSRLQT